ncbi:transcription elongation factor GreB [Patiriisocius marinistellae]|uniref:Transcription elongation factor GreB n=1 Tax=Patiriisocius marinistellae TaxID=2494560 RepID=A0A5J4G067_9FLAO|nr:GreA/GreB family elongation factor [Patiriisocius marinistellae]GEQ85849.1 transcription elongation factor GreB [Patiriisocius marinistellae]
MSRGFVKEDDQEEIPIVPPRADLPDRVTNYVTQVGMDALENEKNALIASKDIVEAINENERRITINYINAKLQLLKNRIASAKVVDLEKQNKDRVLFGAKVTLKINNDNKLQQFQLVGVDEANISKGKISFISPIAKILINKKEGEKAVLKLVKEDRSFEIIKIKY